MAFIKWDDHFSVNVAEIDAQHKNLFVMLNSFYDDIKNKRTEAIGDLLKEVIDYASYHFSTEEAYMQRANYPDYESHKEEHAKFVEKAQDLKSRLDAGGLVLTLEVTNFLKTWIIDHVLETDKKYGDCFESCGIR